MSTRPSMFVAGCLLAACHAPAELPLARTAVKVAAVQRADAAAAARYSARIEPEQRVDLAFKVGGHIERVESAVGVAGEHLLAAGDVVSAGARLASLRAVDFAQHAEEARAATARASAELEQAESEAARSEHLAKTGALSTATLEAASLRLRAARAAVRGSDAQLAEALTQAGDRVLRAPIAGVILARNAEPGSLVAPGAPVFTIARVDPVKAVIGVPDLALARIQIGDPEAVVSEAYPGVAFAGRVTRIAPAADPLSHDFEVEISIPNANGRLKIGMVAAVSLQPLTAAAIESRSVPLAALVRSPAQNGQFAVFVLEGRGDATHVRAVDVELGTSWGRNVPVLAGLTGRERVVVQGAPLLSDGELVEVIP